MARNAEKAQAMLNRWYRMKRNLYYPDEKEMPKGRTKISQVTSLNDCDTWRTSILRDISKKISEVQNAGLGEHAIRELNDEINHLIKDKNKWEERIKELGGPDYKKLSVKLYDSQGFELPGTAGYKYFGASKDLPGVRELF